MRRAHGDERGRFRLHLPQCTTSQAVPLRHAALQDALRSISDLLILLQRALGAYWGEVGVPSNLQDALRDMTLAWNFERLLTKPPTKEAVCASSRLASSLRPLMSDFQWPQGRRFRFLEKRWPKDEEIEQQYIRLCKRLRQQYQKPCTRDRWSHLERCQVLPVHPVGDMFLSTLTLLRFSGCSARCVGPAKLGLCFQPRRSISIF